MKIKALIFALALSSFAFGQKAMVSYQYTIGGNPYGAEAHIFIPKTKFGVWGNYNFTPQEKTNFYNAPFLVFNDKSDVNFNREGRVNQTTNRKFDQVFRSNTFNIGAFYKANKNLIIQGGVGRYMTHTYFRGDWRGNGGNEIMIIFDNPVYKTNLSVGASVLFAKYLRVGVGYDTAPGKLTVSLGAVIR